MKQYLTLLTLLFISFSLDAQPGESMGFLSMSAGASIPLGSFASTTPDDAEAGYARTGFSGSLSAGSLVRDWFGFFGMISYMNHPYNEEAFVSNYLATHPDHEFKLNSDPYNMLGFFAGPYISVPQGIVDINLRGLVGLTVCALPSSSSTSFSGIPGDPFYRVDGMMDRSTAFAYGGGLNLVFYTSGHLAILLDALYFRARPEFKAVEFRIYEYSQLVGIGAVDVSQTFSMISLSAGLAFTF